MKNSRAWVVAVLMAAIVPPAYAHGGGGHRGGGGGFGHGMRAAPGLTPQGRFVHGPAFGHPSFVRRPHFANRVVIGAPLIVPGYYGTPLMPFPDPYAVPPVAYDPPPVSYVPPPVAYTPPAVAYAPPPVTYVAPPRAGVPPTRLASAPPTPIFFCAELHAYTNDLKSMDCPGHWRRMTNY
jgi:hypothetical protein